MPVFHLIYERSGNMWVSTYPFPGWEAIQSAYPDHMTSLEFGHLDELREFLRDEYRLSESQLELLLEKVNAESSEPLSLRLDVP